MKPRVIFSALILFSLSVTAAQAATISAEEVVRNAIDQVTTTLVAEKAMLQQHPDRVFDVIEDIVVPHFDFPIMSRLVLGKTTWRDATDLQKDEFTREFTMLLVKTYGKALQQYTDETISVLSTNTNPSSNLVEVKTEITGTGSGAATPISYRMHISGEEWKVLDLVVDGISLVNSYRGEYSSIVRKDGLDGLISRMKQKNSTVSSE